MADTSHIKEWFILSDETKLRIYTDVGTKAGLNPMAVEKDWWVVHTLSLIFAMDCVPSLVFKGGTSLSKGWGLIERFSEDIDLALDREYLGFKGELSNTQIKKLREKSYHYLTTTFTDELRLKFIETGFPDFEIKYRKVENHDQDPIIIEIYYPKLTEEDTYLKPGILVEVGCRSLIEPHTDKSFKTIVAEYYPDRPFTDSPITVPTVNPERTFWKKYFCCMKNFISRLRKYGCNVLAVICTTLKG